MKDSLPNMDEVVRQEREEALKALEEATPGPWNSTGDAVRLNYHLDVWVCQMYEGEEDSDEPTREFSNAYSNANLIANAPTWLRNALERERLLIEEREQDKAEIARQGKHILGLKLELDAFREDDKSLRSKVAEQDKKLNELQKWLDRERDLNDKLVEKTTAHMAEQDKEIQRYKTALKEIAESRTGLASNLKQIAGEAIK